MLKYSKELEEEKEIVDFYFAVVTGKIEYGYY